MYFYIKNAHILFALLSISLFVTRAVWSVRESPKLKLAWVRTVPHLNDTLLLICAVYMMVVIDQYPFTAPWLTAKLCALLLYILAGTMAIKRGKTPQSRLFYAALAVALFSYIFAVALSKQILL